MNLAPIALFVYNRPQHTLRTLQALAENDLANQSSLHIFADGAKGNASKTDIENVKEVRSIIRSRQWAKHVFIIEQDQNLGLASSVRKGVSDLLSWSESVIVLEDDLVTARGFLSFMNDCLQQFSGNENVWSVTGYMFPVSAGLKPSNALLPYFSTWGWGTWKRRWESFQRGQQKDFDSLLNSKAVFQLFDLADYDYTNMLRKHSQVSWGIQFYFHMFVYHGLSVFPTTTLVKNIGMDGSGTNYTMEASLAQHFEVERIEVEKVNFIDLRLWDAFLYYFTNKSGKRRE